MKILALSGWGQPHDTLYDIVPEGSTHFDYVDYTSIDEALLGIAKAVENHDVVIGWSLGGQLAVRAIATGLMSPRKLVLIGVPFQFVHLGEVRIGMSRDKFQKFRDNYEKNARRTLVKARELIVINDSNHEYVREQFDKYNQASMLEKNWLYWLDILGEFSCEELDFSGFPPSLLLHGAFDAVVEYSQSYEFLKIMPKAKHIVMENAGHAPHWHDTQAVKRYIEECLYV